MAVEQKLEDCRCRVSQLENSLQELTDQTRESEEILTSLDQFGENVEEGMTVLKERKTLIEKCADRLHSARTADRQCLPVCLHIGTSV